MNTSFIKTQCGVASIHRNRKKGPEVEKLDTFSNNPVIT